jgi:hypothetical protein
VGAADTDNLDELIKDALVMADREAHKADQLRPLEWDLVNYSGLVTRTNATISAITQASPGVITAASTDSDVSGHGFETGDIVAVQGVYGMEELNYRLFLATKIDADTLSLKDLESEQAVNTTSYGEYDSGGYLYHAGAKLDTLTILTGVSSYWGFSRVWSVTFDGDAASLMTKEQEDEDQGGFMSGYGKPTRFRHKAVLTNPASEAVHYLFWRPYATQPYNIGLRYQKEVSDLAAWDTATYPQHPPEVHEYIWHGALAYMVGSHERAKRSFESTSGAMVEFGRVEVLFAETWLRKWEQDKRAIVRLSEEMRGSMGRSRGVSA